MLEHFYVRFGDLSLIGFSISYGKQTDRQTDKRCRKPTHVGVGKIVFDQFVYKSEHCLHCLLLT